jgi:hypothetical protein
MADAWDLVRARTAMDQGRETNVAVFHPPAADRMQPSRVTVQIQTFLLKLSARCAAMTHLQDSARRFLPQFPGRPASAVSSSGRVFAGTGVEPISDADERFADDNLQTAEIDASSRRQWD